ncbi:MAG: ACT domain-containing protein [Pseudomonadales bacterium]|nr:ACT domain-containing protein [Pseudomonadales bacterium]
MTLQSEQVDKVLVIQLLPGEFSVHRLAPGQNVPEVVLNSAYYWIGKTDEELSIVCESGIHVESQQLSEGWSCLKIVGPLHHSLVGVLAGISAILRDAEISIFALSTFDTDYILVGSDKLAEAKAALTIAGYDI